MKPTDTHQAAQMYRAAVDKDTLVVLGPVCPFPTQSGGTQDGQERQVAKPSCH